MKKIEKIKKIKKKMIKINDNASLYIKK